MRKKVEIFFEKKRSSILLMLLLGSKDLELMYLEF